MPYLMGGFPSVQESARIALACADAGADVIELGVPYSDPLADGPVIHEAATKALAAGTSLSGVLEVARIASQRIPVVLMCYANMVFAPGVEAFVQRLTALIQNAGLPVAGPKLSPADNAGRYLELMRVDKKAEAGEINFVLIAAPGSAVLRSAPDALVRAVVDACCA